VCARVRSRALAVGVVGARGVWSTQLDVARTKPARARPEATPSSARARSRDALVTFTKQGITLPAAVRRTGGPRWQPGVARRRPRLQEPEGVSQAKFFNAEDKCGGPANSRPGGFGKLNSAKRARRDHLRRVACAPTASKVAGAETQRERAIFNTTGIKQRETQLNGAEQGQSDLKGVLPGR